MMTKKKVGVLQLPGTNCEHETCQAIQSYGMSAILLPWTADRQLWEQVDAYVIPGGFSYQDRIRSGVIAAHLPHLAVVQEAIERGKPVLGICNGCQILAEMGALDSATYQIAMAANRYRGCHIGFICKWVRVRLHRPHQNIFFRHFSNQDCVWIPMNHAEGRFCLNPASVSIKDATIATYEDPLNGSMQALAGIGNKAGNVFAMMPHPERAAFGRQMPRSLAGTTVNEGSMASLFLSLREAL